MRSFLPQPGAYDFILASDVLYFLGDGIQIVVPEIIRSLSRGGSALLLYSAWAGKDRNLAPEETRLGSTLNRNRIPFSVIDFSEDDRAHWLLKRDALRNMKEEFLAEGSEILWERRTKEADIFADFAVKGTMSRYLYIAGNP
jgi:hypothetical protein